ncbi:hypothetical protein C8R43DRAFT_964377 [Mycena crocata]|nr:hypothetical protein C8R43DRAFT_964377 [Mycena crocata]
MLSALKTFLPRLPTFFSLAGATISLLPALYNAYVKVELVIESSSSRVVNGLATPSMLSQDNGVRPLAAYTSLSPPPPPPPPPPRTPAYNAEPANEGEQDAEENGGSDDDPQEDGAVRAVPDNNEPDLQVADAPAPEDPPPPPGGIEEDGGEDDDDGIVTDGGLPWLVLLLVGSALFSVFERKWASKSGSAKVANVEPPKASMLTTTSSTIPGLLRSQIGFLDVGSKSVSSPATLIAGLLQRRPAAPRPSQQIVYQGDLPQEAPKVAAAAATAGLAVLHRHGRLFPPWARSYVLLALLPFFVITLLGFTLSLGVAAQVPPPPAPPPPPPPDPKILGDRIAMVELFQRRIIVRRIRRAARHAAKYMTQKEAMSIFALAIAHRQTKTAAELQVEEDERARRERVREVQRRFWPLLVELAVSCEE